jgi:polyribonucleotide nucleotidyltransferase
VSVTLNSSAPNERILSNVSIEHGTHPITLEIGRMAFQATAAVLVRSGDTEIIVPIVATPQPVSGASFSPILSIHYKKTNYADGHIPGNHGRREGRPSDEETVVSRGIDRPLRAVFPEGFYHEVQISPMVISSDPNIKSDILAMVGASAALALSGLPCRGPVAAGRVGYIDGKFVFNPTQAEMEQSLLDLVIAGTETGILMIEAEADALKKEIILDAISFGHEKIKSIAKTIGEFVKNHGKPRWVWEPITSQVGLEQRMRECLGEELQAVHQIRDKLGRKIQREALRKRILAELINEAEGITTHQLESLFDTIESKYIRESILTTQKRLDGRDSRTIRPIQIETGLLARAHGSALFTRGLTQALVTATLGSERDAQLVDGLDGVTRRDSFMLHYNFPPYCVGEVGQMGSPKRREIGHGNLAKRALRAVLPDEGECPYVLRVVSDIMSCDGSSSMATICGAVIALWNAGIKLKGLVAGIAMGGVTEGDRSIILSDISEDEDHIGDMDLKVAGTREGITAIQMDIKTDGITHEILSAAITQGHAGIQEILDKMESAISAPQKVSPYAPQIMDITIPIDKIQALIGKGGATIRAITEETGTLIDIHRDTGLIRISTSDAAACERAVQRIKEVTATAPEVEIGVIYEGVVIKLMQSGAIVSILPGRRGFVHVTEAVLEHPDQPISDVLREKQRVMVKVLEIDRQTNRIRLTMKGAVVEAEQAEMSS